jgi:predicted MPP superfamily phosphohydrolase
MCRLKIVQISDLHYSPVVWRRYLIQYVAIRQRSQARSGRRHRRSHHRRPALRQAHQRHPLPLRAPLGVVCTFGNHDYGMHGKRANGDGRRQADFLEKSLRERGLIVLRNQALYVRGPGAKRRWLVGLDDEWSGTSIRQGL